MILFCHVLKGLHVGSVCQSSFRVPADASFFCPSQFLTLLLFILLLFSLSFSYSFPSHSRGTVNDWMSQNDLVLSHSESPLVLACRMSWSQYLLSQTVQIALSRPLQRCSYEKALKDLPRGQSSTLLCDSRSDDRFLVCQRDEIACESCASGYKWNYVKGACDLVRSCKPIPQYCAHLHVNEL